MTLALALTACQSTPPAFPPDYRMLIAYHLALDYEASGKGAAEISPMPRSGVGLIGAMTSLWVRYPVLATYQLLTPGRVVPRCINISASTLSLRDGLEVTRPRQDLGGNCPENADFVPFTELEGLAERIRACRREGTARCAVSEPGARRQRVFVLSR